MERRYDFVARLDTDVSLKILTRLDDPKDVTKLEAVSSVWRQFVVVNKLQKKLCLKLCPEISKIVDVKLTRIPTSLSARMANSEISENLEREHRVFTFLACGLVHFPPNYHIHDLLCSSPGQFWDDESSDDSDDSDEKECGRHFLSRGTSDPTIPVTIMYEMSSSLGVISEVSLKPNGGRGPEKPIFSAEAVRFSMGHEKPHIKHRTNYRVIGAPVCDNDFKWLYTSPKFPMAQNNELQQFRLDRPVLCIGGILKVELLGRISKHHHDDLYHIWLDDVQASGRSLDPVFDVDIPNSSGNCTLICDYHVASEFCKPWRPLHPRRDNFGRLCIRA